MHKRLFIGIALPDKIKLQLQKFLEQVEGQDKIRKIPAANQHMTLLFLGKTAEALIPAIEEQLAAAAQNLQPFTLSLDKYKVVKRRGTPSMVWAQYFSNEEFIKTVKEVIAQVNKAYPIEPDHKKPIPHITLVRCKFSEKRDLDIPKFPPTDALKVKAIHLWESKLSPKGAKYILLKSFPLEG